MARNESKARELRRTRQRWRDAGLCADCGGPKDTETRACSSCLAKRIRQQKAVRKIAEGKRGEIARALGIRLGGGA